MDIEKVGDFLQIPRSKQDEIDEQYECISEYGAILWHNLAQNLRAHWDYWLTHHPAPSWNLVAIALWKAGKHETLEVLQKTYLKGKPYTQ